MQIRFAPREGGRTTNVAEGRVDSLKKRVGGLQRKRQRGGGVSRRKAYCGRLGTKKALSAKLGHLVRGQVPACRSPMASAILAPNLAINIGATECVLLVDSARTQSAPGQNFCPFEIERTHSGIADLAGLTCQPRLDVDLRRRRE